MKIQFPKHNAGYAQARGLKVYAPADTENDPDAQHYIIKFDDAELEDIQLKCSEEEAITHWENFSFQWNCYLFELKKVDQLKGEQHGASVQFPREDRSEAAHGSGVVPAQHEGE